MRPLFGFRTGHIWIWLGVYHYPWIAFAQVAFPDIHPDAVLSKPLNLVSEDSRPCQQACAIIASSDFASVFIGQTGNFEFWDAKQAELVPSCRVEPSSAEEISSVLKVLVENRCHFAIKSGGHERTPGSSNIEGGVVIDLVRLSHIEIADDKRAVNIGAGLRWFDVYQALEKEQLMVLGGRISDVGAGGLLLGGGISFFSNEYGLACDSIVSYELVLPNTTIVDVDQQSHPALYKALRGAGASNFGVVTSFTLEAFPVRSDGIWFAQKMYPWERVEDVLQANYHIATQAMDDDESIAVMNIFFCSPIHNLCMAMIQSEHTRHDDPNTWPKSLEDYEQIEGSKGMLMMGIRPVSNITAMIAGSSPPGLNRYIYGTFSYIPNVELEYKILEIFREEVESVRNMTGFLPGTIMHPLSKRMIAKMRKNGGNALESVAMTDRLVICNFSWQWSEKIDDERSYAAYYRLMARVEHVAKELGVWHPYKYINYAEATQDVWTGYGSARSLRRLQRQIDPTGIFAKDGLAGGFFKLNLMSIRSKAPHSPTWKKSEL